MSASVFVDGQAGTIGLRIRELLATRSDISLLEIPFEQRKDRRTRQRFLNECDIAILCLPDDAAVEAVALIENPAVRVIDGSTAHRTTEGWVYGLPELAPEARSSIREAKHVSNPGCWATCISLLTRPLVKARLLSSDAPLTIHGVSGYTGGGRAAIARWESNDPALLTLPFELPYSLSAQHKHIPEIQRYGLLRTEPQFSPAVGAFATGMRVQVPLHATLLSDAGGVEGIVEAYRRAYSHERFVSVAATQVFGISDELAFLDPRSCNGTNCVQIHVVGHPNGHVILVAILDNLGKGASGAAVQSLNLMLGLGEATGLAGASTVLASVREEATAG